jgi:hypothetical protein
MGEAERYAGPFEGQSGGRGLGHGAICAAFADNWQALWPPRGQAGFAKADIVSKMGIAMHQIEHGPPPLPVDQKARYPMPDWQVGVKGQLMCKCDHSRRANRTEIRLPGQEMPIK